jgi:Flp pilus assembly CpaE family ATPase
LCAHYAWTVVELGCTLNLAAVAVIDEIDDVFLVTTLAVPALHHARRAIQNPGQRRGVGAHSGMPIDAMLPNDYNALCDAFCPAKLLPPGRHLSR